MNAVAKPEPLEIEPGEALARQRAGALLLDVREDDERAAGIAAGAVGLARGSIERHIGEIAPDRQREVVAICASGPPFAARGRNIARTRLCAQRFRARRFRALERRGAAGRAGRTRCGFRRTLRAPSGAAGDRRGRPTHACAGARGAGRRRRARRAGILVSGRGRRRHAQLDRRRPRRAIELAAAGRTYRCAHRHGENRVGARRVECVESERAHRSGQRACARHECRRPVARSRCDHRWRRQLSSALSAQRSEPAPEGAAGLRRRAPLQRPGSACSIRAAPIRRAIAACSRSRRRPPRLPIAARLAYWA